MRRAPLLALSAAASLAACEGIADPPTHTDEPELAGHEVVLPTVAAAIARSMASPDVRGSVLAAMRASHAVEHRLMLADFLASPEGEPMRTASAAAFAMNESDLVRDVAALGPIEIVVPLREHRLTWTGTSRVGVSPMKSSDVQALLAYDPAGTSEWLDVAAVAARYDALFVVRQRETIGTRIGRQADGPGRVIQDPDDGEGAVIHTLAIGDEKHVVDFGAFASDGELQDRLTELRGRLSGRLADDVTMVQGECAEATAQDCDGGGGGGNGDVTNSPTSLNQFELQDNTEWGSEEVEITVGYTSSNNTHVRATQRYEGVDAYVRWPGRGQILPVSPAPGGVGFYAYAYETDWGPDDYLGHATFNHDTGPGEVNLRKIDLWLSW